MAQDGEDSTLNHSRVAWLAEQIAYHSDLYYNQARNEISDAEFDALWDELKQLEPDHPQLQRVGACLLYTSPSPRDRSISRMPSSA